MFERITSCSFLNRCTAFFLNVISFYRRHSALIQLRRKTTTVISYWFVCYLATSCSSVSHFHICQRCVWHLGFSHSMNGTAHWIYTNMHKHTHMLWTKYCQCSFVLLQVIKWCAVLVVDVERWVGLRKMEEEKTALQQMAIVSDIKLSSEIIFCSIFFWENVHYVEHPGSFHRDT